MIMFVTHIQLCVDVTLVTGTEQPEQTVAKAARGDYMESSPWFDGATPFDAVSVDDDAEDVLIEEAICDPSAHPGDVGEAELQRQAKVLSLLRRLIRRGHWGPFEHAHVVFGLRNIPVVVTRHMTRHRHLSVDMQSMRYVTFDHAGGYIPASITDPEHATREGTVELDDESDRELAQSVMNDQYDSAVERYEMLLDLGVPEEDARYLLPVGTTVNLTLSGNLRAIAHVHNVRSKANVQAETREVADQMFAELADFAPITTFLLEEHGPFPEAP